MGRFVTYIDSNIIIRLVEGFPAVKAKIESMDAIHYATAVEAGCSSFLTGDRAFLRCAEVKVEIY
jgi:hypothetical protein